MDASDDESDGECEFDVCDLDFRYFKSETKVLLKKEPGPWVARNPDRLLKVINLKLELPDNVSNISDSIGDLLNLERLIIKTGINLNCLPYTLPTLLHLDTLRLENCPNLSQLPSNFDNLVTLRSLTIRSCGIKFLPQSLSLFQLTHLELINCVFIQELPPGLDVHILELVGCHVKSFSAKPRYLDQLEINNCLYVNDILTTLNHFDSLRSLHIKGCDMESLPNSITGIHNLTYLVIEDCINLRRLPQNLSQLADLTLINCGLESIPSELCSLTSLSIQNCPMEFLVIKESVSLIDVTIKSCNIKSLDGCITGLTKLERLSILYCVVLEDLPTDINTLVSLRELHIEGCTSIKFLPSLAALHNLKQLSLKGCSRLNELPADMDELTILKTLNLTDTNVQSLPSTIAKLPNLEDIHLPGCFRLETLTNNFDLEGVDIYLPLSFRLDILPAKFSVTRDCTAYQLHFIDQKESRLELINDKECDDTDECDGYWQTMVNTPPNLTHLPQPRPGSHDHHVEGRDCDRDLVAGKVVAQIDSNTDARNLVGETSECEHVLKPVDHCDLQNVCVKSTFEDIQQSFSRNMSLENTASELGGHGNQLEERDRDRHVAGKIAAQSDSNIDARNVVGETINHAFENEQLGIMTSECEDGLEPFDLRDVQNVPVKSKRQRGEIILEMIQEQYISRNMTLVNAADELGVSRSTLKRRLKELKIEWPSSRKGKQNNSSKKKKNHNPKSTIVSESLERISVDGSDPPDQAHASECSDVANQLMLPEFALADAEKTWLETLSPMSPGNFGTNVIGETRSCITPTAEDGHSNAFSLVSQGRSHHLSQESGGPSSMMHNKADKRLNVSLATSKRYREPHACGMRPSRKTNKFNVESASGSKSTRLDSDAISIAVHQEHTQHLHASSIEILETETDLTQRLDPKTMVRVAGDTRNATHDQICQDNPECVETCSVEAQDGRTGIIVVKAEYKEHLLRFDFLSTSSVAKLKEEVMKRLPLHEDRMMIKYKDEDNDWVLLACADDLRHCLRLSMSSESKTIRLMIVDS